VTIHKNPLRPRNATQDIKNNKVMIWHVLFHLVGYDGEEIYSTVHLLKGLYHCHLNDLNIMQNKNNNVIAISETGFVNIGTLVEI
jgi:NDP-sugar pyrophosphorylase family protein